jgi:hypothetical protein
MISFRSLFPLSIPLLFSISGCASASGTFAPLDASHPASAEAPEVPIQDPSAVLRAGVDEPARAQAAPAPVPSSAPLGAYVCPMHPEVSAAAPGRCSKCGMQLVPRAEQATQSEEHPHGE